MMIVDCFTFYNELDLLTYRLNALNSVVDYFVLVEARQTHMGKDKELFYEKNKERYAEFKDKIIHIVVDLPINFSDIDTTKNDQWINEKYQRNCLRNGIDTLKLKKDDLILISDLDEIPDPETLEKIKRSEIQVNLNSLHMKLHYYNLNIISNQAWKHPKILSFDKLIDLPLTLDDIRRMECPTIQNGGWHLSYFGDSNFIKNKIENFAHQEFNNNNCTDMNKINQRLSSGQDIYGRSYVKFNKVPISQNAYLPPEFRKYLTKFIVLE
jgi:beta-1,4-mannosyl-glycoprotein beta-1,4-N-acetylglucosaminyltransferase